MIPINLSEEYKRQNEASGYLALVLRQKFIKRWSLMNSKVDENVLEHSSIVALLSLIAGHLAIQNGKDVDVLKMVGYGLVHDQVEVIAT